MEYYCNQCNCDRETSEVTKDEEVLIKDKKIKAPILILVCKVCSNEVFEERYAEESLRVLNDKYVELYGESVE